MSLKVMDGLRTLDGANMTCDLPPADRTNTAVNTTGVDMSAHNELLVSVQQGVVDAGQVGSVKVQESNEAAANFTDITGAVASFNGAASSNLTQVISVDWRSPERLKYARLVGTFGSTNSALVGAVTMRVGAKKDVQTADGALVEVDQS